MTARRLVALTFLLLLAVWTWLLVRPNPIPEVVEAVPSELRFLAAKCLHGGTYAFLTILGTLWPTTTRGRTVVVAVLLAHGVGTEIIQTFVPNRSGKVLDVVVDWSGIAVGLMVLRFFVRNRLTRGPVLPTVFEE